MGAWDNTALVDGALATPPPGWGRWTDHVRARLRARSIDDDLLDGRADASDPVIVVRCSRLMGRRYRSKLAGALRKLVAAATEEPGRFAAKLPLRSTEVIACGPLILELADEVESASPVSPRGVILADRLVRDGDSPVYAPLPVSRRYDQKVESTVTHARAALHLG
jgi:hypothetical protein